MLLGTIGVVLRSRLRILATIGFMYVLLHFVVLPNWDERWFAVFYLAMTLCAATVDSLGWSDGPVPTTIGALGFGTIVPRRGQ
jgi:hypothetical protein